MIAATGLAILSTNAASAQTTEQCDQVRAAVATYGYAAAKAYAEVHMSLDAVRAAESCLRHPAPAAAIRHVVEEKVRRPRFTD